MFINHLLLQEIFHRLATATPLSKADLDELAQAVISNQIEIKETTRSVAVNGNVNNAIIITGDGNKINLPQHYYQETVKRIGDLNRNRQDLIERVRSDIEEKLKYHHSYLSESSIDINLKVQSNQTDIPEFYEKGASGITDFFNGRKDGFVISGEAGSGKTVTLLLLAKKLLDSSIDNYKHIPILISASSWKDWEKKNICEWLTHQLKHQYKIFENTNIFLRNNQSRLVFLIDDLHVLQLEKQMTMVEEINNFLYNSQAIIILSCRTDDYKRHPDLLKELKYALCTQRLEATEIFNYLGSSLTLEIREKISSSPNILKLLEVPLFLAKFKTMLESEEEHLCSLLMNHCQNSHDVNNLFFEKYTSKLLNNNKHRKWLEIIANRMQPDGTREFLIEEIKPSWFDVPIRTRQVAEYKYLNVLIIGFISFVIGIPVMFVFVELPAATYLLNIIPNKILVLLLSVCIPIASAIFVWDKPNIKIHRRETLIPPSLKRIIRKSFFVFSRCWHWIIKLTVVVNILTWFDDLWNNIRHHPITVFVNRLIPSGLASTLIVWLSNVFNGDQSKRDTKKRPNEGIRKTCLNAFVLTFIIVLIAFFVFAFLIQSQNLALKSACMGGLLMIIFCLHTVWFSSIQYFSLRVILWWHGYIPWDYAQFLDCAANDYRFMQRTGGGYRFIHPLLQQYFANRNPNPGRD